MAVRLPSGGPAAASEVSKGCVLVVNVRWRHLPDWTGMEGLIVGDTTLVPVDGRAGSVETAMVVVGRAKVAVTLVVMRWV